MRPEHGLLLSCVCAEPDATAVKRTRRLVSSSLDWDYLIETASLHGVLPLLCYNLNRSCADTVPVLILRKLNDRFRANSVRNLSLAAELLKICQLLENNGIGSVPFKGPVLAVAGYGNLAVREFCDLDILVKENDFAKAKQLFLAHGFEPWRKLTPVEEAQHFLSDHAYTLVRSQDGLRLDLHWRITQARYAFGLDLESLWSRVTTTPFFGTNLLSMAPEDLLIVLCIHGSKHCWERLAWVCDVAEVVRSNPALRWDDIISRSRACHISRSVLLGLHLAKTLVDAPLPEHLSSAIQNDRGVGWISALIQKRLFARAHKVGPIEKAVLFFMMREQLRNKLPHLGYSFHRAITPNEHDRNLVSLPAFIKILYYPLRIMRLATVGARGLVNRLLSRTA